MKEFAESTVKPEIDFIVQQITAVLYSPESRQLLIEVADHLGLGFTFKSVTWDDLDEQSLSRLIEVSICIALCRAFVLVVKADRQLSAEEVNYAQVHMSHIIVVFQPYGFHGCPCQIESRADVLQLISFVENSPKSPFEQSGLGGTPSTIPKLCALSDPFVDNPLLPVFLFTVRSLCVSVAASDGTSPEEERVISKFDDLVEDCKNISAKARRYLPPIESFTSQANDSTTLPLLRSQIANLDEQSRLRERQLKRAGRALKKIQRRLRYNQKSNRLYIGDALNVALVFLVFACLIAGGGVGLIVASGTSSLLATLATTAIVSGFGVQLLVVRTQNLTWFSTDELITSRAELRRDRYRLWSELRGCNFTLSRLQDLALPLITEERLRLLEEARRRAEELRRQREMAKYVARSYGPIQVRSYYRRDGTFVSGHTRRR